jgi:putative RNA 2'-phosphotransferase
LTPSSSELSRLVSRLLRHEPWLYELELDDGGWVAVDALLAAVRRAEPGWTGVDRVMLGDMIGGSSKRRHEVIGDRVRALYGHSVPGRLCKQPGVPPMVLFHGTSPQAAEAILVSGLHPQNRQFVHLSVDRGTALEVGRRKTADPVVLRVGTVAALAGGVLFLVGNETVWLAASIPAGFVSVS